MPNKNEVKNETAKEYKVDVLDIVDEKMTLAEHGTIMDAIAILDKRIKHRDTLNSPQLTRNYLRLQLHDEKAEVFCCLFLDTRNRVLAFKRMFHGTIDAAAVYPREVVREALNQNAACVIFAHNHPSGCAEPSHADEVITKRLKDGLALIDVRVLDHFIIGDEIVSMAEKGLI